MWPLYPNQSLDTDISLNGENLSVKEQADQQGQWQVTDQKQSYIHQQYPNMFSPYPHKLPAYPIEEYNQYSSPNFQSNISDNTDFYASLPSSASQYYQELDFETQESAMAASLLYEYTNPHPLTSLPTKSSPLKYSPLQKSPLKQSQLSYIHQEYPNVSSPYAYELPTYPVEEYNQYSSPNFQGSICENTDFCTSSESSASQDYQELDFETQESAMAASLLYEYTNPHPLTSLPSKSSPLKSTPLRQSPLKSTPLQQPPSKSTPLQTPPLKRLPLKPSGTGFGDKKKSDVKKRIRIGFDTQQFLFLAQQYEKEKYLGEKGRALKIANRLEISEYQVKVWFRNRRAREPKEYGTIK